MHLQGASHNRITMTKEQLIERFLQTQREVYRLKMELDQAEACLIEATEDLAPYIESGAGEVYNDLIFDKKDNTSVTLKDSRKLFKARPDLVQEIVTYRGIKQAIIEEFGNANDKVLSDLGITLKKGVKIVTKAIL